MKSAASVRESLVDSQNWRLQEIQDIQFLCGNAAGRSLTVLHRSLVLLLYAHLEGFTKDALQEYLNYIAELNLNCADALPVLATSSLKDEFKCFYDISSGVRHLPSALKDDLKLRRTAIEARFVSKSSSLHSKKIAFGVDFIDTESNLDEEVLRKNLFRLGLDHQQFRKEEAAFSRLKRLRNAIAHGQNDRFADNEEAEKMIELVSSTMQSLIDNVDKAIKLHLYKKGSTADFFSP